MTIEVVGRDRIFMDQDACQNAVKGALEWFYRVEECCTRFDTESEAMRLCANVGIPVRVSAILFEATRFALTVAELTDGTFEPTIGYEMETRGFNQNYITRQVIRTNLKTTESVSYRDVHLDPQNRTVTLDRPLVLDLSAVAKGLAVDLAARELHAFENFAIDAGGDLYLSGCDSEGSDWSVGIRHPRRAGTLIDTFRASNKAVCTSGDYERRSPGNAGEHHILDPRTGFSAATASVTVVAPTAMAADALSTAALVLGPAEGIKLLEITGVEGLIISPTLERFATAGMPGAN